MTEFCGAAAHVLRRAIPSPVEPSANPHHSGCRVRVRAAEPKVTLPLPVSVKCLDNPASNCPSVTVTAVGTSNNVPRSAAIVTLTPHVMETVGMTVVAPRRSTTDLVTPAQGSVFQICAPSTPVASATPPVGGRSRIQAAIRALALVELN